MLSWGNSSFINEELALARSTSLASVPSSGLTTSVIQLEGLQPASLPVLQTSSHLHLGWLLTGPHPDGPVSGTNLALLQQLALLVDSVQSRAYTMHLSCSLGNGVPSANTSLPRILTIESAQSRANTPLNTDDGWGSFYVVTISSLFSLWRQDLEF